MVQKARWLWNHTGLGLTLGWASCWLRDFGNYYSSDPVSLSVPLSFIFTISKGSWVDVCETPVVTSVFFLLYHLCFINLYLKRKGREKEARKMFASNKVNCSLSGQDLPSGQLCREKPSLSNSKHTGSLPRWNVWQWHPPISVFKSFPEIVISNQVWASAM